MRSLKYGANSFILIALVVIAAVIVNLLVGMADLKLDLTPNKLFSLSDPTKNLLKETKKEVRIIGLFDDGKIGPDYKEVTDLLNLYSKYPNVKVEYIDPDKNPGIIKDLDKDKLMDLSKQDFVIMSGEKKKKLSGYDLFDTQFDQQTFQTSVIGSKAEQSLTGAIKYVTSDVTPVVYFTEGHEEIKVDESYTMLKEYLEKNNYDVKTLNALTAEKIPEDAQMLIVASPKRDLSLQEKDKILDYLKNGGKALFMFDFLANDPDMTQFNAIFGDFNLALNYDRVAEKDENRHLPGDPNTILLNIKGGSIIPQDSQMVLVNSRSVSILKNTKEFITSTSLLQTSDQAVGEMIDKTRGEDIQGPLDIAVAVEHKGSAKPSKIIVMGNASFISDGAASQYGDLYQNNMYFFLSSLNWMMDKKDELIVPTKNYEQIVLNINESQMGIMFWVVVVLLPLIILGAGLFVFMRRRHL